jgi:hypothetical protein
MEKRATFSVSGEVGSVFGELMLGGRQGDAGTRRARRRSSPPVPRSARKCSRLVISDRLYETAAGSPDRQSTG